MRDNVLATGGAGVVIGTEYEPDTARARGRISSRRGFTGFIDLREGDLRETLTRIDGPVEFMLVDIWIPMARPALELVTPHLRRGAIVSATIPDDIEASMRTISRFSDGNGFRTMTAAV